MSRNETVIAAPSDEVFKTLTKAENFAHWVLGSKIIREVDEDWPAEGSVFHHAVGIGPIHVEDHTKVLECDEPHRLVLRARARPAGVALIRLLLEAQNGSTRVVMEEETESGPARLLPDFVAHFLTGIRNVGALRRLKGLVEEGHETIDIREQTDTGAARETATRSRVVLLAAAAGVTALAVAVTARRRRAPREDNH